jgi:hypothetical protein
MAAGGARRFWHFSHEIDDSSTTQLLMPGTTLRHDRDRGSSAGYWRDPRTALSVLTLAPSLLFHDERDIAHES